MTNELGTDVPNTNDRNSLLFLEPTRVKRLAELQIDCGEADGLFYSGEFYELIRPPKRAWNLNAMKHIVQETMAFYNFDPKLTIKTYRLDRLLAKLPEFMFRLGVDYNTFTSARVLIKEIWHHIEPRLAIKIYKLWCDVHYGRGQAALNACADLLILLKENDLL